MTYQVLIVDDEEIVCRGLTRFVKWSSYGFQVAGTASGGEEALSLLKRHISMLCYGYPYAGNDRTGAP